MSAFIPKVTIDHNSIVALHKRDNGALMSVKDTEIATAMDGILKLATTGVVDIVLPAIAANERQQKGQEIGDFTVFRERIESLGIKPAMFALPEMRLSMSFLGHATLGFAGPEWYTLQREIQQIIHPSMDWDDVQHKNWLNRYCDVSTMFAHLQANAELFVSDDGVFHAAAKKKDLLSLGANMIETAQDAFNALRKGAVGKASPLDMPIFDTTPEKRCTFIPTNSYNHYRQWRKEHGLPAL